MRRALTFGLTLMALGIFAPGKQAQAHFVLQAPPNWWSQDSVGSPQKLGPCGDEGGGSATNVVTSVQPGQMITVTIDEMVFHPGHYRIALSVNNRSELPPEPPVTMGSTACGSVPVQNPAMFPVLADGVFTHTSPFNGPQSFQVKIPNNITCSKCTLQVLEFMSNHPAPCFYHHCADLAVGMPDAGNPGNDGGTTNDSGTSNDGSSTMDGNPGSDGGSTTNPPQNGCSCTTGGSPALSGFGLFIAVAAFVRSRTRRKK